MKILMKIIVPMMYLIPKKIRDRMKAPMLQKGRYSSGKNHPTIEMNLTNLLICIQNCGTCPSYSGINGEALYCASGPSVVEIKQNGCNCVTCPILDQCSAYSTVYFCIKGSCAPRDARTPLLKLTDLSKAYLQRFISQDNQDSKHNITDNEKNKISSDAEIKEIDINFIGDKKISTYSNISILEASLDSGIPHTHICGGRARCSTCRVIITEGLDNCQPRNELEQKLAKFKGFSPEIRLACQTTADSDISLRRLVLDENDISEAINQGRSNQNNVGREIDATIMFSDIRSFTSFSEYALPYDVIHVLNRYFEQIGNVIDNFGGYIDKYMGDGIMVVFGLDHEIKENHAVLAASAAVGMENALQEFNEYLLNHFNHEFKIGIGLHSGTIIIGNLGFNKKRNTPQLAILLILLPVLNHLIKEQEQLF